MMPDQLVPAIQCVGRTALHVGWGLGGGTGDPDRRLTTATSLRDFYSLNIFFFLCWFLHGKAEGATNPTSAAHNAVGIFSLTKYFFAFRARRTSKHDERCPLIGFQVRRQDHACSANTTDRRNPKLLYSIVLTDSRIVIAPRA